MTAIIGTQGNDTLSGMRNDAMSGDLGDDTYIVDSDKDITFERTYSGTDTVKFDGSFYSNSVSYNLAANIENLDLSGLNFLHSTPSASNYLKTHNFVINGNASNNIITASSTCTSAMQIFAGSGADTVYGGSNSDNIDGGYGCDTLFGNDGNDTLFGGNDLSVDSLIGGAGNDTYILRDTKDIIKDISGLNTLKLTSYFAENKIDLTDTHYKDLNVETIDASAVTKALSLITEASTNTTIIGGSGNDVIKSGSGNDSLNGGLGNDYLFAGAGSNVLNGGLGNDTYAIDGSEFSTKIIDAGGLDTIKLLADKNGMFKKDGASLATFSSIESLDASTIKNTNLNLIGNNVANTITGGAGNDKIVGGVGNDTMIGGKGDDVYYSDSSNDSIIEKANKGSDTIKVESNFYSDSKYYTLANEIENLDLSGLASISFSTEVNNQKESKFIVNGNLLDNIITTSSTCGASMQIFASAGNDSVYGGNSNDYIDGGSGNDLLRGGGGNDVLLGVSGNDKLYGEDGDDILKGGAGKDFIDGGKGNDTLTGGAGNNVYFFDKGDGNDLITATNKGDIIKINNADGITKNDLLFYTDDSKNFFVDYTDNGVGTDTIEIANGKYNGNTTVQVGNFTININSIISQLAASGTAGLDSSSITALNTTTETTQASLLAHAWTTA